MKYRAEFLGRRIDTDKAPHEIVFYVDAESAIEAKAKLSEKFEDIKNLKLEWPTATQLQLPTLKLFHPKQ